MDTAPTNSPQRVLVVDDEAEVRQSIRVMLETYGYVVSEAESTRAALAIIEGNRPSVVLTDIFLGDDDGFELLNAICFGEDKIPVIAMSGGGSGVGGVDVLSTATKLGAVAIIDKPFRSSNLVEMIDRAIAGRGSPARR